MLTSETRRKTFKEIEKEEGTDAAIEAGILSDPLYGLCLVCRNEWKHINIV